MSVEGRLKIVDNYWALEWREKGIFFAKNKAKMEKKNGIWRHITAYNGMNKKKLEITLSLFCSAILEGGDEVAHVCHFFEFPPPSTL